MAANRTTSKEVKRTLILSYICNIYEQQHGPEDLMASALQPQGPGDLQHPEVVPVRWQTSGLVPGPKKSTPSDLKDLPPVALSCHRRRFWSWLTFGRR